MSRLFIFLSIASASTLLVAGCDTSATSQFGNGDSQTIPVEYFAGTDFGSQIFGTDKPVIIDFTASWCPPCQQLKPILNEIEESGMAVVVPIDTDENPGIAQKFGVKSIPHLVFVNDGKQMGVMTGFQEKSVLERAIREISQ